MAEDWVKIKWNEPGRQKLEFLAAGGTCKAGLTLKRGTLDSSGCSAAEWDLISASGTVHHRRIADWNGVQCTLGHLKLRTEPDDLSVGK